MLQTAPHKFKILISIRDAKSESVKKGSDQLFTRFTDALFLMLKENYERNDIEAYNNCLAVLRWDYDDAPVTTTAKGRSME